MKIYNDEEMELINNVFDLIAARFDSKEFSDLVKEIKDLINENNKYARETERLNQIINKYDKELKHKTEQYEYLRHSENKEIERLNNIINGMEEFFKYELEEEVRPLNDFKVSVWTICLDKLQELKGSE